MKNNDRPFFPHKCLGKGCSIWGIESSIAFVSFFYTKIGVNPLINVDNIFSSILK